MGRIALREWLLLLGFVLVLAAGVFTVALPELSKEPEGAESGAAAAAPAHDSAPAPGAGASAAAPKTK